ncbi:probable cytochrome P450 304a1 [Anabrus simplex]|uniref:probable cytochrome P450 304a1 n=1 Tax=Anabrus simplex TaxID=316456 RepID=UPI0035A37946
MSPLLLLAVIVLFGVLLYRNAVSRPPNFPPGPPRLPIWGSYWLLLLVNYKYFHLSLLEMAKRYKTKILGFYLGPYPCVVACDHDSVNELQRRPEFQARPDIHLARVRSLGGRYGILFNDGPEWTVLRRFFLRQMRDFGFGRRFNMTEAVMQDEVRNIVELFNGDWKDEFVCKGGKVLLSRLFGPYSVDALWSMFGGERFPRGKQEPLHMVSQEANNFMLNIQSTGRAVSMTTWLQYLSPRGFGVEDVREIVLKMMSFIKKSISEHKATFKEDHMRDFIDVYLKKMKYEADTYPEIFNDNHLLLTGLDMVLATATALASTLTFLFHCLLHYPEVQKKIQAELDQVIGRDRIASIDDRQRMPYLEATLRESMRYVTPLPLSVPHLSTEDTYFQGYFIPKYTIMYPHLAAAHMDPEVFEDPESFRPERFLDENGRLLKKDLTTPFGAGKRLCVGETFSRQIMFLFTAGLLQHFTFEPDDPANLPPITAAHPGFSLTPVDIWARIIPRS